MLFVAGLLPGLMSQAQYQMVGQITSGQQIHELSFINKDTGWLCAYTNTPVRGYVYKTTNGGTTWQQVFQCSSKLVSIQFINSRNGFIAGYDTATVFRTNDGGSTWQNIKPDTTYYLGGPLRGYNDVFFTDSLTGYVGSGTELMKTINGGQSWFFLRPFAPVNSVNVKSIFFHDAMNGAITGEPERNFVTNNGGVTWTQMFICTGGQGCTNDDIVMFGSDTLRSMGGLADSYYSDALSPNFMTRVSMGTFETHQLNFITSQVGYAISYVTSIVKRTDNGGRSWVNDGTGTGYNNMSSMAISNDKAALYIGTRTGVVIRKLLNGAVNQPDLSFNTITSTTSTARVGETINLNYTAQNSGTAQSSIATAEFYLSADNNLSPASDQLLKQTIIPSLASGATTANQSTQVVVPCSTPAGNYFIIGFADAGNINVESNESNNTFSIPVTISALNYTASSDTICLGSAVQFAATGATSYEWSGNGLNSTSATVSVTPTTTGTIQYSLTGTTGSCTKNITVPLTVYSGSTAQILNNDTSICHGGSVQLRAAGGKSYTWSPATGLNNTTGNNVIAQPSATTTYILTNDCGGTDQVTITVPADPVVTVNPVTTTICPGNSVTLTASGATSYTWSPATGLSTTSGAVVTASPSVTTTYNVTGINNNGCSGTAQATVTVTSSVVPSVSVSMSGCPSGNIVFQANSTNGGTNPQFTWYVNNVLSGNSSSFILNNATNGTQVYATMLSNANCATPATATSSVTTINCITTAIGHIDGLETFSVSPNPSHGAINVRMKLNATKKVTFRIINETGATVYFSNPTSWAGQRKKLINIKVPAGLYYLETTIGNQSFVKKVVIR